MDQISANSRTLEQLSLFLRAIVAGDASPTGELSGACAGDLSQLAVAHGLEVLLWHELKRAGIPSSGSTYEILEKLAQGKIAARISMSSALEELGREFAAQNIAAVTTRAFGPVAELYPDSACRTASDIDLVIGPAHMPIVVPILERLGYSLWSDRKSWSFSRGGIILDIAPRPSALITVTRHPEEAKAFPGLDHDWLAHAIDCEIPGIKIFTPPMELMLSALHYSYKHHFGRMVWALDLVLLARNMNDNDLKRTLELVRRCNCTELFSAAMRKAATVCECELPLTLACDLPERDSNPIRRYILNIPGAGCGYSLLLALFTCRSWAFWFKVLRSFFSIRGCSAILSKIRQFLSPFRRHPKIPSRNGKLAAQLTAAMDLNLSGGEGRFTVSNNCMAPALADSQRVLIDSCLPEILIPGDVVLLRRGEKLFLHRFYGYIEKHNCRYLLCKGDKHIRFDELWSEESLVGKLSSDDPAYDSAVAQFSARSVFEQLFYGYAKLWACLFSGRQDETGVTIKAHGKVWSVNCTSGLHDEITTLLCAFIVDNENPEAFLNVFVGADTRTSSGATEFHTELEAEGIHLGLDFSRNNAFLRLPKGSLLRPGLEGFFRALASEHAACNGGICMHASAVVCDGKTFLFAGPSGTGKTTAAESFGDDAIIEEDFVLLLPDGEAFACSRWLPWGRGDATREDREVAAIFLPEAAEDFSLLRLGTSEAITRCLHIPSCCRDAKQVSSYISAIAELSARVPVYRLRWAKGQNLPLLIRQSL